MRIDRPMASWSLIRHLLAYTCAPPSRVCAGNVSAGVVVQSGADPIIASNRIHEGLNAGVFVHGVGTKGQLENNQIWRNRLSNFIIAGGSDPSFVTNVICNGQAEGVLILDATTKGRLEGNCLYGNARGGVRIHAGAPYLCGNTIRDHVGAEGYGLVVGAEGLPTGAPAGACSATAGPVIAPSAGPVIAPSADVEEGMDLHFPPQLPVLPASPTIAPNNVFVRNEQGNMAFPAPLKRAS